MLHQSLQYAIPLILLIVGLEAWLVSHHQERTYRFNNALANLSAGMVTIIISASSQLLLLLAYTFVFEQGRLFDWQPAWIVALIAFFAYELMYYWKHRLGHEVNLLWGGHHIHHQSEDMNLSTGARLSATMPLWTIPFTMPLALLGIPPLVFLSVQFISHLYQFFLHTEHIKRLPSWFSFMFNTPSHHRVHHGTEEEYLDKNYGAILILYDRLFGTFQAEGTRPNYGILHPLYTWNPVYANFGYYGRIFRWLGQCHSWRDRWLVLFGRPDALPTYLFVGEESPESAVILNEQGKYDPPLQRRGLKGYIGLQFVLSIAVIYLLLTHYAILPSWAILLLSAWALWALGAVGRLLEGAPTQWPWSEVLKHLVSLGAILLLFQLGMLQGVEWLLLLLLLSVVSLSWWYFLAWRSEPDNLI